ncbi:MAG: hypothetical protein ABI120_19755 [Gemmatimonadaceae bacterium]
MMTTHALYASTADAPRSCAASAGIPKMARHARHCQTSIVHCSNSRISSAECAAASRGATAIRGTPVQLSVRTDRQLLQARAESVRYILVSIVAESDRSALISEPGEALLTGELAESLDLGLHNAALTIAVPDGAVVTLLNRFRSTHDCGSLRVEFGDITPSQELQLVLRIQFPAGVEQSHTSVIVSLTGNGDGLQAEREVTFRYVSRADHDMAQIDRT